MTDKFTQRIYKNAADRFLQTLGKVRDCAGRTKKRLIWELIQNAKDVRNRFGRVSIRISLQREEFEFSHNGDAFSEDDFIGLVQQTSSKDSQNEEGQTGKFGSGFISTYLLSPIIQVTGVACGVDGRSRRFSYLLDRRAERSEELALAYERDAKEYRRIFESNEVGCVDDYGRWPEERMTTSFLYKLATPQKIAYASEGVQDLVNTLPVTLVNQDKIKSVEVLENGRSEKYTAERTALTSDIYLVTVHIERPGAVEQRKFLDLNRDGLSIAIEVRETEGGIALCVPSADNPKLLRDFPLIGSEHFHLPFYLNGSGFWPNEDRNGIFLNNVEDSRQARENREILEKAIDQALSFNTWLVENKYLDVWRLAQSRRPDCGMDTESQAWFEGVQAKWRQGLLKQALLPGCRPVGDLCLPFASTAKVKPDENDRRFCELVREVRFPLRGRCAVLPEASSYADWTSIVEHERRSWGNAPFEYLLRNMLDELADLGSIANLAQHAEMDDAQAVEWLERFLAFVLDQGEKAIEMFDRHAVIPNDAGTFCLRGDLCSDWKEPIPCELKRLYDLYICEGEGHRLAEKLIHTRLGKGRLAEHLTDFGMTELVDAVKEFWSDEQRALAGLPCVLGICRENEEAEEIQRRNLVAGLAKEAGLDICLPLTRVAVRAGDLWQLADRFWAKWILLKVKSCKTVGTLAKELGCSSEEKAVEFLSRLIEHIHDFRSCYAVKEFESLEIFPCQDGGFRNVKSGIFHDKNIPEELKDLFDDCECLDEKFRAMLLDRCLRGNYTHECDVAEVSQKLNAHLEEAEAPLEVACRIVARVPVGDNDHAQVAAYAKTVLGTCGCEPMKVQIIDGFDWKPSIRVVLDGILRKISTMKTLGGLRGLEGLRNKEDRELVKWLDQLIMLVHNMDNGTYAKILLEDGLAIWVNQNGDFKPRTEIGLDKDMRKLDELKDLAKNPWVGQDVRASLLHLDSELGEEVLHAGTTLAALARDIDLKIREYYEGKNDPRDENFRKLVYGIKECSLGSDKMPWFFQHKDILMSRVLGDEKLQKMYQLDQLLSESLKGKILDGSLDPEALEQILAREESGHSPVEPETDEKVPVLDENGREVCVSFTSTPYAGLSREEMGAALMDAKRAVQHELKNQGFEFTKGLCENRYSCIDGVWKDGVEYPLVVHSYISHNRKFQLNAIEWDQLKHDNAMLWIYTAGRPDCLKFADLFRGRGQVNISFDASNLEFARHAGALAGLMRYFSGFHLNFELDLSCCQSMAEVFTVPEKPCTETACADNPEDL